MRGSVGAGVLDSPQNRETVGAAISRPQYTAGTAENIDSFPRCAVPLPRAPQAAEGGKGGSGTERVSSVAPVSPPQSPTAKERRADDIRPYENSLRHGACGGRAALPPTRREVKGKAEWRRDSVGDGVLDGPWQF